MQLDGVGTRRPLVLNLKFDSGSGLTTRCGFRLGRWLGRGPKNPRVAPVRSPCSMADHHGGCPARQDGHHAPWLTTMGGVRFGRRLGGDPKTPGWHRQKPGWHRQKPWGGQKRCQRIPQ